MATTAEVKEEREQYSGRKMMTTFHEYCASHKIQPNEDSLKLWDEKHNRSRIRESFGSRDKIYAQGLLMLYRRFLDNNPPIVPVFQGRALRIANVRPDGRGGRVFLTNMDQVALDYNVAKIERQIETLVRSAKFFGLSLPRFLAIVEKAWEAASES